MLSLSFRRSTTILCVRRNNAAVIIGDGQVTQGKSMVAKDNARKVRRIGDGNVVVGFAGMVLNRFGVQVGSTADAIALMEKLEAQIEKYPGQLKRACVETAKLWRYEFSQTK